MPEPYVGEIRMFGGSFAPAGWAFCSGQLIPISENDTLFTLIGTTYGGDGQSTFALPDLQGRVPMHQGTLSGVTNIIGEKAGVESVTLTTNQIPVHSHPVLASTSLASTQTPGGNMPAQAAAAAYSSADSPVGLDTNSIAPTGGSQPHTNMQPYLCISFIISLFGVYPPPQ
jgi:microcystin-dependent protein